MLNQYGMKHSIREEQKSREHGYHNLHSDIHEHRIEMAMRHTGARDHIKDRMTDEENGHRRGE